MAESDGLLHAPLGISLASPAPVISAAAIASGLVETDHFMVAGQFNYSIPTTGAAWTGYVATREPATFEPLNTSQAAAFVAVIAAWDQVIAPNFTQTNDVTDPGYVRVGFSSFKTLTDRVWGYTSGAPKLGRTSNVSYGDIWINADVKDWDFSAGSLDFQSMLHEVGHVLGLKHSFEAPALPAAYRSGRYTVMSYDDDASIAISFVQTSHGLKESLEYVLASTPMVLDIAAVQSIYGADQTTALGNTTYAFRQDEPFRQTIYDAGGVDTIDTSTFSRPSDIDLTPGSYSSLGFATVAMRLAEDLARYRADAAVVQAAYDRVDDAKTVVTYTGRDNLGIAFSTTIENAIGGSGNDTITGNAAANALSGGAGRDFIRGMDGDDVIDGGVGDDDLNGNLGVDVVRGGDGADSVRGGQGNDSVYGDAGDDPHLNGNLGNDLVYGGAGRDTLFGGQGADTLYGDDGDDWLSGDLGDDVLVGGAGADRYLIRPDGGNDWATGFSSAAGDRVQLPTGTAYSLTVQAGQVVVSLTAGGQLGLAGISMAQLGADWLVFA
jgi:serralysin